MASYSTSQDPSNGVLMELCQRGLSFYGLKKVGCMSGRFIGWVVGRGLLGDCSLECVSAWRVSSA